MATEIVNVYQAIYATVVVDKAQLLVCGTANGLWAYDIDTRGARGHFLDRNNRIRLEGHKDMVRCLVQSEHRLFSAGFDKRLVVFDTSGTTEQAVIQCTVVRDAHAGIISCLVGAQNAENQFLLISGSFDRSIKLWSEEGQLVHALRCFNQPITSIAYIPVTNTFWVAAVETAIKVFEIQTCIEVTDICGTFDNFDQAKYQSDLLKFCPEINIIVGSTHRNNLMIWRSNVRSSVVALWAGSGIQTLAVNPQEPDNFYSMGTDNRILIWIRKGQTHYGYFSEEINLQESMEASLLSTVNVQLRLHTVQSRNPVAFKALFPPTIFLPILPKHPELSPSPRGRIRSTSVNSPRTCSRSETRCSVSSRHSISLGHFHSVASEQPLVTVDHGRGRNFLRALYVDQLELLVAACEDGMVYVFGYDYQGTRQFLRNVADGSQRSSLINSDEQSLEDRKMDSEKLRDINQILNAPKLRKIMNQLRALDGQPMRLLEGTEDIRTNGYANHQIHLERNSLRNDDDVLKSVSRQLFGLKCQLCLLGHQDSVTSLLVLPPHVNLHGSWTLLSSGWDRKICIWDLETGQLLDRYHNLNCTVQEMKEIAADGAILDMAYNEEL
ncbi:hypothetical protein PHET_06661 [Paragonimus heterotremus]|uniref:Uncharacterized protein n=1 Tax=Paragonimus heterotremus TaxID=100268 RepID=A0A8J4WGX8_9TREM|nr:hypothetical protein PHET_06661 [Paragonimus heterotremus]